MDGCGKGATNERHRNRVLSNRASLVEGDLLLLRYAPHLVQFCLDLCAELLWELPTGIAPLSSSLVRTSCMANTLRNASFSRCTTRAGEDDLVGRLDEAGVVAQSLRAFLNAATPVLAPALVIGYTALSNAQAKWSARQLAGVLASMTRLPSGPPSG